MSAENFVFVYFLSFLSATDIIGIKPVKCSVNKKFIAVRLFYTSEL